MPEESILTVYKPLINNTYHTISSGHPIRPGLLLFFLSSRPNSKYCIVICSLSSPLGLSALGSRLAYS